MNRLKVWLRALRAHFLTATVAPVLVGTAAAWYAFGRFDLLDFALAFLGAALVHLGANLSNDYFDFTSETDSRNAESSAYSGGSRVIQQGLIPARQILVAALVCLIAGSLVGIFLVWKLRSIPVLVLGLIGVFCAYFYTGAPLRLGYRGLAEVLNGLSFGPVITLGACVVQAGSIPAMAVLASIPPGILLAALLTINEFPDYDSDRSVGKRTIVVIVGKRRALPIYHGLLFLPFLWVPLFVIVGTFPPWTLLSLASLPFGWRAFVASRGYHLDNQGIMAANMSTFFLHLSFNCLLALGFLLARR